MNQWSVTGPSGSDADAPDTGVTRAVFGGDQVAGSKNVYNFNGGFGEPFPVGFHPYSAPMLENFRPFVQPEGLGALRALLCGGPVAALRGRAGLGKHAAALGLLTELGAQRFYAVDPEVRFPVFEPAAVDKGSGLILDGLSAAAAARLRRYDLDRIGQVLSRRDSWLVVILDEGIDWADPGLAELTAALSAGPPARAVVEAHLRSRLGALRAARAQVLLDHPRIAGQLESLPAGLHCAAAADLGRLLAEHAEDPDIAADLCRRVARARGGRELVEWFTNLPDLATKFFAIALAFAEGEPVETVAAIADTLDRRYRVDPMARQANPDRPWAGADWAAGSWDGGDWDGGSWAGIDRAGSGQVPDDPFQVGVSAQLRQVHAVVGPRIVYTRFGADPVSGESTTAAPTDLAAETPLQGAQFVDQEYAKNLLRHVWTEYGRIRPALVALIESLGTHPSESVRTRAADAADALARDAGSFAQIRTGVIAPWAESEDAGRNDAAAVALHAVGRRPELAGPVRKLVRTWAASGLPGLRATAAGALGRQAGGVDFNEVSTLLTMLAADERDHVANAVGRALTRYTADEASCDENAMAVFGLVEKWTRHRDLRVRRTAQLTVMVLAGDLVRAGDPRGHGGAGTQRPDRQRTAAHGGEAPWPGLLWFAERGPGLGRQAGRLWAAALTSPEFGRPARELLDRWARRAEHYREHREALGRLLFAAAEHDRARRILGRRAAAWAAVPGGPAPRTGALVISVLNIS